MGALRSIIRDIRKNIVVFGGLWLLAYLLGISLSAEHTIKIFSDPITLANVVVFSYFAHEMGHMAIMQLYGIQGTISAGLAGPATITDQTARTKIDQLSLSARNLIHMGGVMANALFVVAALLLALHRIITISYALVIAGFNV